MKLTLRPVMENLAVWLQCTFSCLTHSEELYQKGQWAQYKDYPDVSASSLEFIHPLRYKEFQHTVLEPIICLSHLQELAYRFVHNLYILLYLWA